MPAPRKTQPHRAAPAEPAARARVGREEPSDEALVLRARSGDRWAQEAIFRRYVRDVTNLVQRVLRRRQDADDIVQDAFSAALTTLDTLREPASLRSWLLGIAVHRVRRRHRKLALLRALWLDRAVDDSTLELLAAPDLDPEQRSELALIDRALATVPSASRIAWMLRHVEGERLEDVAAILGCSLATAKRRISEADARVARHLEGERR